MIFFSMFRVSPKQKFGLGFYSRTNTFFNEFIEKIDYETNL